MPELNLNFAPLPPWLTKNEGKPEFLEAKAAGQRDRQLGMQEQELESRLISAHQDQQLSALKQAEIRRLRDETIEAELAVQEKAPFIASLMRQGKTEEALNEWQALGIENGKVRASKSYSTIADDLKFELNMKESARLRTEMEQGRKERAAEALKARTVSKPEFLDLADALRTTSDPAERARIEARMASMSKPAGVNEPEFIDLLNRREQAVKSGNTNEVKALDTRLAFLGGERPDTSTPEYLETLAAWKRAENLGDKVEAEKLKARLDKMTAIGRGRGVGGAGGASGDLTTANVTKAQETLTSAEDALGTILQILPLWSMETTGPVGTAGRAFEATVGQVLPGVTSEARSRIDTLAPLFQGQLAKLFRSDAQMAEPERKSVAEAVPKPSASLNPTKASQQGQQAVLVLMQRARRAAEQLGQPLPPGLDPVQMANKVRQAVSESGLPVIEGFKTVDELRAEMRGKQRGKSAEEQQRILREYAAKIAASPYRDLAVPNATAPPPNATLDFMQGR